MPLKVESLSPEDKELDKLVLDELSKMEKESGKPETELSSKSEATTEEAQAEKLISEDEEKLISDVVNWLKLKKNRDVILERIWSILVHSECITDDVRSNSSQAEETDGIPNAAAGQEPGKGRPEENEGGSHAN